MLSGSARRTDNKERGMEWTFGNLLWSMLAFFFWFAFLWMFISIFADILRRDLSGWAKAGWILLIVVLPFLGTLIYLIATPRMTAEDRRRVVRQPQVRGGVAGQSAADEIAKAALLHDEGKITADEFELLKQQALSH
jgi:Phospholipase_D-nuclease N-terminal